MDNHLEKVIVGQSEELYEYRRYVTSLRKSIDDRRNDYFEMSNLLDSEREKTKKLEKQLEILKEAVEYVAGVDAIKLMQSNLKSSKKSDLVIVNMNDIKKCREALKKLGELDNDL